MEDKEQKERRGAIENPESKIQNPKSKDVRVAIGSALAYLALFQITQHIPFGQVAVVLATLISLVLTLVFAVSIARALRTRQSLAINTILSGLLASPSVLVPVLFQFLPTWSGWATIGPAFRIYRIALALVPGLHGLLLIWFAATIGVWLSRLLREMKILLPIAVVLACIDLYVVFGGGLVTQANTGKAPVAQTAMKALTVNLPTIHPSKGAAPMVLAVGFADFLFIALFFACFARFCIPSRRTFSVLCGVLCIYLLTVYFARVDLPALVPISVVVIGMNLRAFRYERSEAFALLYAALIVAAVLGGLLFFTHRPNPPPSPLAPKTLVPRWEGGDSSAPSHLAPTSPAAQAGKR